MSYAGLSEADTEMVLAARSDISDRAGRRSRALPGFPVTLYEHATAPDGGAAAVWALQRQWTSLTNMEPAAVFARHAAVAAALRRRDISRSRFGCTDTGRCGSGLTGVEHGDFDDFNRSVAADLRIATGAPQSGLLVWDEQSSLLRPVPGAFGSNPERLPPGHAPDEWRCSAVRVFVTGEPYITNRAADDPGVLPSSVERFGLRRLMTLPIELGTRRIGVLQAANKASDFTIADLKMALRLGSRIAMSYETARMRATLMRRHRLEEILAAAAVDIASGRDLNEWLSVAMDAMCVHLDGSLVAVVPRTADPVMRRRGETPTDLEGRFWSKPARRSTLGYSPTLPRPQMDPAGLPRTFRSSSALSRWRPSQLSELEAGCSIGMSIELCRDSLIWLLWRGQP